MVPHMPGGRPSLIDKIIGYTDDKPPKPITVADVIVSALRAGSYFEPACNAAGITSETGWSWRRTAGQIKIRAGGEPITTLNPPPTPFELRCVAFADAVAEGESAWEVNALATLERCARGGLPMGRTVEKRDAQGNLTEMVTTTEFSLPDVRVLMWRLERRFPKRYGRRVEVTGEDGGPLVMSVDERTEQLASTLEAYLQGQADAKPKRRRKAPKSSEAVGNGQDPPGPSGA